MGTILAAGSLITDNAKDKAFTYKRQSDSAYWVNFAGGGGEQVSVAQLRELLGGKEPGEAGEKGTSTGTSFKSEERRIEMGPDYRKVGSLVGFIGGWAVAGAFWPGAILGAIGGHIAGRFVKRPSDTGVSLALVLSGAPSQSASLPVGKTLSVSAPKGGKVGAISGDGKTEVRGDVGYVTTTATGTLNLTVDWSDASGAAKKSLLYVTVPGGK